MRAFIAVDLPPAVRAALAQRQADFRAHCESFPRRRADERVAWTRPDGIHLTLKFLGQIADAQVSEVKRALAALGGFPKFMVEVKGLGFFPSPQRPRVFWAGIEAAPGLGELAARVEGALARLGFAPERRDFTPHLTLARFRNPRPLPALEALIQQHGESSLGSFEVTRYFLFESRLTPGGAEYRKVESFPQQD